MGRGGLIKEWAAVVGVTMCYLFVSPVAAADFTCYDCASLLSPESSCETGPDFNSTTKCKTYCYTDVTTQAGVRSNMKRGCTTELECTEESTCRELSRTGPCRSCCQTHICNDDSPDDLNYVSKWVSKDTNGAGQLSRVWTSKGRGLGMIMISIAMVIAQLY